MFLAEDKSAAALWLLPEAASVDPPLWVVLHVLWPYLRYGGWQAFTRILRAREYVDRNHPNWPHYYLFAIGVLKESRGRGRGGALLDYVLQKADLQGVCAYLENTNERSLPLYERRGFRTVSETRFAEDAPPIWLMLRLPNS